MEKHTTAEPPRYFLQPGCNLYLNLYYGPPRYPRQIIMLPVEPEAGEEPGKTFFVHILN